jgi:uncharacterized protein YyaL (SSP411 family)
MSNNLSTSSSLYLRQHADNPVDWWPWGEAALTAAKEQDKPILVSVGYSSCHWCHVMARECFQDTFIAGIMNRHFICIKVDREEHPEVDQLYMDAVTMITQRGGWPLHAFCLPDGRPFFGGTYFPPEDRGNGIIPWPQLLMRIADAYKRDRAGLLENADSILKNIEHLNNAPNADDLSWNPEDILKASQQLISYHDDKHGGFGPAPKFPPSHTLNFLFRLRESAAVEARPDLLMRLDTVLLKTCRAMASGGLYDHLGGGFFRYCIDTEWKVPHFEKMLPDTGLLLSVFSRAWRRYRDPRFAAVIRSSLLWLEREMHLGTGYASSLDAETEGHEGAFYVWNRDALTEALPADRLHAFCAAYGVTAEGNFDGHTTHLNWVDPRNNWSDFDADRAELLALRDQRIRPQRDDKIILAWNCLVLRGMVEAGFALGDPLVLRRANSLAERLWKDFADDEGNLRRLAYPGRPAEGEGYLDDYAFFAEAILVLASRIDLLLPGTSGRWVDRAEKLARRLLERLDDAAQPGFFSTPRDLEVAFPPAKKEWYDNALPTGNSALLHVFSRLSVLRADPAWEAAFTRLRKAYSGLSQRIPNGIGHALAGLTEQAIGFPVLKVDARPVDPVIVWEALLAPEMRDVFVQIPPTQTGEPPVWELCVGAQCFEKTPDLEAVLGRI